MATAPQPTVDIEDESTWPADLPEKMREDLRLRIDLQAHLRDLTKRMEAGEDVGTMADLAKKFNEIAEKHGSEYGIAIPSDSDITRPMVLARGTPLSSLPLGYRTELEEELAGQKIKVRNSWEVLGDQTICVVETEGGPMALPRWHSGHRLRKLIDTTIMRAGTALTAETEMKAMDCLKGKLADRQFDSYVLNGCFSERSVRSDLHYIFRKGYPTIALSYHQSSEGKVLACLCLHPLGYYQGTYCGLMTPTDEVICQLLMMRADEHGFWKRSGQWAAIDTRSGL